MDHNNTQEGTLGGTLARLDGGIAMGSSHSNDGRTTMNSFDATVSEQQTSSNQEKFSEGRRCRQAPEDSEETWCLRAPGRGENKDKKEFQEKCSTEPVGGLKNRQARASKDKQGGKKDFKKKGGDRKIVREGRRKVP